MTVDFKKFAWSWLVTGSLVVSFTACDLGTYGRRLEKSKANRPAGSSTVSQPAQPSPPVETAEQPTQPGFAPPRNQPGNLPAASVGGGGGG